MGICVRLKFNTNINPIIELMNPIIELPSVQKSFQKSNKNAAFLFRCGPRGISFVPSAAAPRFTICFDIRGNLGDLFLGWSVEWVDWGMIYGGA